MKQHVLPLLALIGVCLLWMALFGCSHVCVTPEDRAAYHGEVLECRQTQFVTKGGHVIVRCLVNTKDGDKTYDYGACK